MKCRIMHYAAFYLDLRCLPKYAFTCFQYTKGYILIYVYSKILQLYSGSIRMVSSIEYCKRPQVDISM